MFVCATKPGEKGLKCIKIRISLSDHFGRRFFKRIFVKIATIFGLTITSASKHYSIGGNLLRCFCFDFQAVVHRDRKMDYFVLAHMQIIWTETIP